MVRMEHRVKGFEESYKKVPLDAPTVDEGVLLFATFEKGQELLDFEAL